eukprot:c15195_g1_i1.p1 GENE.c15195_g1_i1~~c15195_g1_i1.p1  ORF type:complete len:251 (+),score=43.56 c15195_g1_i1:59-811(+)
MRTHLLLLFCGVLFSCLNIGTASPLSYLKYMQNDYYGVLGLEQTATLQEIKRAYRNLSLSYHPDKVGVEFKDKFMEIAEAYEILSDNSTRQEYDAFIQSLPTRYRPTYGTVKHSLFEGLVIILGVVTIVKYIAQVVMHYEFVRRVENGIDYRRVVKKAAKEGRPPPKVDVRGAEFPSIESLFIIQFIRAPYQIPVWLRRQFRIMRCRIFNIPFTEDDKKYLVMKYYNITENEYEEAVQKAKEREKGKKYK